MKNDTRNNVSAWRIGTFVYCSVSVCLSPLLVVSQAYADVPTPPPAYHKQIDTSFPSGKALLDQGYNPNTGVLRVEGQKTGKPTVISNGQTVTGTQNARVVVTDQYGNKGTMTTKITQTANTAIIVGSVANAVGNSVNSYADYLGHQINNGDYSGAAQTALNAATDTVDSLFFNMLSGSKKLSDRLGWTEPGSSSYEMSRKRMDEFYNGGGPGTGTPSTGNPSSPSTGNPSSPSTGNPSSPSTGNPSSPSTGNPSSPSTGTPTSPGNPSNPSSGGGGSSGLGSAANAAGSAQRTSEKNGDVSGAVGNAAFKKAGDAAANAAKLKEDYERARERLNKGDVVWVLTKTIESVHPSGYGYVIKESAVRYTDKIPASTLGASVGFDGYGKMTAISGDPHLMSMLPRSASKGVILIRLNWSRLDFNYKHKSDITPSDMTLTAEEIKQILQRMFVSQQTNHQEMMRQLSQIAANTAPNTSTSTSTETTPPSTTGSQVIRGGDSVVDQATTSRTVSTSEAISAPFTPAGSNVAGRTKFTLHSDGSVTTTFVPDTSLKPHSSQAPTRVSMAPASSQTADATTPNVPGQTTPSPTTPDTGNPAQNIPNQPGSQQNQEQRDFCQMNPTAAACMELGNGDYEDLDVPESELDLNFEPADIFQTDGVCPEPKTVDLGIFGTVEFSYQMLCDFASKIRPILVAMTVLVCAYFAYESVREL